MAGVRLSGMGGNLSREGPEDAASLGRRQGAAPPRVRSARPGGEGIVAHDVVAAEDLAILAREVVRFGEAFEAPRKLRQREASLGGRELDDIGSRHALADEERSPDRA